MVFKSNLYGVLSNLNEAEKHTLNNIGTFVTAEAQLRATVLTGKMRRSTTFDIAGKNEVDVGATKEAPYAVFVEKGTSKQRAQPFIEPAVMDNIEKLEDIAGQTIKAHMG